MSLFKEKKSKVSKSSNAYRKTLDATHNEFKKSFSKEYGRLPILKDKLSMLEKKSKELHTIKLKDMSDDQINLKFKYEEEIEELKNKIHTIQSKENEKKYMLDTSLLVFQYYESKNSNKKKNILIKNNHSIESKNTIVDFFKTSKEKSNTENTITKSDYWIIIQSS